MAGCNIIPAPLSLTYKFQNRLHLIFRCTIVPCRLGFEMSPNKLNFKLVANLFDFILTCVNIVNQILGFFAMAFGLQSLTSFYVLYFVMAIGAGATTSIGFSRLLAQRFDVDLK